MLEKIIQIKEGTLPDSDEVGGDYDGYYIETTTRKICVGIANYQDCCEDWGYLTS